MRFPSPQTNFSPYIPLSAPNMGGAEQGNNPGQQHFARETLAAMVRETIQNSLDHHEDGLPPVEVSYQLIQVSPEDIGAQGLSQHILACLEEIEDQPETEARYQKMLELLRLRQIPCLAVIDTNTTGLQGQNWDNLILREGVPAKGEGQTKGGSFGFGKNAPFNLAGAGAVIYSTRYLSRRKGKVEQMAGRAQLRTHTPPGETRSQGTGFLAVHQENEQEWNLPIRKPDIPKPLLLTQKGTGVFMIGFNQQEHPRWEDRIIRAALEGFFPAIMQEKLAVHSGSRTLDHRTLPEEIQALGEQNHTWHYHQALQGKPMITRPAGDMFGRINGIQAWISTHPQAPHRLAHVNRRGMLITQSREQADNPLYPRGGTGWQPWCAVTTAADDETERYLRSMEPPAHDAIQSSQLPSRQQQDAAWESLKQQREQIGKMVRDTLEETNRRNTDNIQELADLFPITGKTKGRNLEIQEKQMTQNNGQPIDIMDDGDENTGGSPGSGGPPGEDDGNEKSRGDSSRKASAQLRGIRILRGSQRDLMMRFTTPREGGKIRLGLRAAGEQYQRLERPIIVQEAMQVGDITATAWAEDGQIVVEAPPNTGVEIMLRLAEDDTDYHSYRLALKGAE